VLYPFARLQAFKHRGEVYLYVLMFEAIRKDKQNETMEAKKHNQNETYW
jgi:hypothetical protein